jgi:cyclophilin family peptidyl-prolyl cis-trans isomerase
MQNYKDNIIGYFIGGLAILIIAMFVYAVTTPTNNNTENTNVVQNTTENNATSTQETITNQTKKETKNMEVAQKETYKVTMETNKGTVVLELNSKIAPNTAANFVKLSQAGFYDGVKFHRVIKDFMIQAGDPQSKDDRLVNAWGTGGPGYQFADEITDPATYKTGYKRGVLAMANSGPNTNGSQFFIMHKDVPLPPNYTIFGKVISGLETVDAIAAVQTGASDRPVSAVVINKISVE